MIRQEDVDHWKTHGYVLIENLLSPEEIKKANDAWQTYMPTWEEYQLKKVQYKYFAGTSRRNAPGSGIASGVRYDFPFENQVLNQLAIHPYLVAFAERITGTEDLALNFSILRGKYAGVGDFEQSLHSDLSNNTLVIPPKGHKWLDIPMIWYLTDVTPDLGPTYVVSQEHTEHRRLIEDGFRDHTRERFPELYEVERPTTVPAGSVMIYSMRTFHRGSAMKAKEGCRIVQFTGFHTNGAPWSPPVDYQLAMGSGVMNQFLISADPDQRRLVGFPPVGHSYWEDSDSLEAVSNRYPKMDMRPYGGGPAKEGAQ